MMDEPTAHRIGDWIERFRPPVVDLTGGAPELNAQFRYLVECARAAGAKVIDRNNLTILEEPGFDWLPSFLAEHDVEVVASLPCYQPENVAKQRGGGVFEKSIRGLRTLNAVGYGTRHPLHLVYNPLGPTLPAPQAELEADYKEALLRDHGIVFHQLYTITNQPIARFAADLREHGQWDAYLELLAQSFNPATLPGVMCRSTLSVDYQGGSPLRQPDAQPRLARDGAVPRGHRACGPGCNAIPPASIAWLAAGSGSGYAAIGALVDGSARDE
jgi:radical SAM/Cys-rich protein